MCIYLYNKITAYIYITCCEELVGRMTAENGGENVDGRPVRVSWPELRKEKRS
jgi:hypothetical protein